LAKFVAIFTIEIVWLFFDFGQFRNDTRWVEVGRGKNIGFSKVDEVLRVVRVFCDF